MASSESDGLVKKQKTKKPREREREEKKQKREWVVGRKGEV